ncbi:MAG: hypothetical protein IIA64_02020 [Planctomycetes bacterium]|nr:hypothetical protein [Planctomycetota bacterium]
MQETTLIRRADAMHATLAMLVLCAFVFCATNSATAQGTSGMLPDPISSRDMEGYARRLQLDEFQRLAIDPLHEQYRAAFRQLREDDIAKLLKQTAEMTGGGFRMPQREKVERLLKDMKRAFKKIEQLDNRLFNQMDVVLTDDQRAAMPRVRLARARQRYRNGAMGGGGFGSQAARIDLSEIYAQLELSDQELLDSDPLIASYERRLTPAVEKLYEATMTMSLDMLDAFEAAGMTDLDMTDPESAQQMMETMQAIWADIGKDMQKKSKAIADLNRKTLRSVRVRLSPEHARDLRHNYYRRAFPMAPADPNSAQKRIAAALRLTQLTEDQRLAITDAAQTHQRSHDRITDEMIKFIEDYNEGRSMFDFAFDQDAWRDYTEKLQSFSGRWRELNESANASLEAQLGPELAAKLSDPRAIRQRTLAEAESDTGETTAADPPHEQPRDQFGRPLGAAVAISGHELDRYAEKLSLTDEQQAVVQLLHEEYRTKYAEQAKQQAQKAQEKQRALFAAAQDDQSGMGMIDIQLWMQDTQDRTIKVLEAADEAFFSDLALMLSETAPTEQLDRLRLARQRRLFGQRPNQYAFGFPGIPGTESNESSVDLSALVDDSEIDAVKTDDIDALLKEYEKTLTRAFRTRYESGLAAQRRQTEAMAEMMRRQREGDTDGVMAFGMEYQQMLQDVRKPVEDADKEITQLNRDMLAQITVALDDRSARKFRAAYRRKAFPDVYNEPNSGEKYIEAAMKLRQLSDDQRLAIELHRVEYQPVYENLCNQMVEIHSQSSGRGSFTDPGYMQEYMQRQQKLEVIKFDRSELNAKARRRLRQILTPEQLARIGLAPEELPSPNDRPFIIEATSGG